MVGLEHRIHGESAFGNPKNEKQQPHHKAGSSFIRDFGPFSSHRICRHWLRTSNLPIFHLSREYFSQTGLLFYGSLFSRKFYSEDNLCDWLVQPNVNRPKQTGLPIDAHKLLVVRLLFLSPFPSRPLYGGAVVRNHYLARALCARHQAVSYTHLTLPTIYSV